MSFYQLGEKSLKIPMALFAINRKNLLERLRKVKDLPKSSIVLLEGGKSTNRHCTDHEDIFRQVLFNLIILILKRLINCLK
jgi:Xaa-Pro dipeptidase